jgi:hypothetical protein
MANNVDLVIGADVDDFEAKFSKVIGALKRPEVILAGLTVASALALATLVKVTDHLAKTADTAGKVADRIGANVAGLTELQFAAKRSGVAVTALNIGLQRQVRRVSEAAQGMGEAKKALKDLGLEAKELNKLEADEQFIEISKALERVEKDTDKVRLAFKLWDSEGVALLQTMADGEEGLAAMREEARKLGVVISEQTAEGAKVFNDSLENLKSSLVGLGNLIGSDLLRPLANLFDLFTDIATSDNDVKDFVTSWTAGFGQIINLWTAGTRQIIFLNEEINNDLQGLKKEIAKPVKFQIVSDEAEKKLNDLRQLIPEIFEETDPSQVRNFFTAQQEAKKLEDQVEAIKTRVNELNSGFIDINTDDAKFELRDLQLRLQEIREQQAVLAEPRLRLEQLFMDLKDIEENFDPIEKAIQEPKVLKIQTRQFEDGIVNIKAALDSIPDETVKDVRVRFIPEGFAGLVPEGVIPLEQQFTNDINRGAIDIGGGLVVGGLEGVSTLE